MDERMLAGKEAGLREADQCPGPLGKEFGDLIDRTEKRFEKQTLVAFRSMCFSFSRSVLFSSAEGT